VIRGGERGGDGGGRKEGLQRVCAFAPPPPPPPPVCPRCPAPSPAFSQPLPVSTPLRRCRCRRRPHLLLQGLHRLRPLLRRFARRLVRAAGHAQADGAAQGGARAQQQPGGVRGSPAPPPPHARTHARSAACIGGARVHHGSECLGRRPSPGACLPGSRPGCRNAPSRAAPLPPPPQVCRQPGQRREHRVADAAGCSGRRLLRRQPQAGAGRQPQAGGRRVLGGARRRAGGGRCSRHSHLSQAASAARLTCWLGVAPRPHTPPWQGRPCSACSPCGPARGAITVCGSLRAARRRCRAGHCTSVEAGIGCMTLSGQGCCGRVGCAGRRAQQCCCPWRCAASHARHASYGSTPHSRHVYLLRHLACWHIIMWPWFPE
jgi:hypothetical protein